MTRCPVCSLPLGDCPRDACFRCLTPEKAAEYRRELAAEWRQFRESERSDEDEESADLRARIERSRWYEVAESMSDLVNRRWG